MEMLKRVSCKVPSPCQYRFAGCGLLSVGACWGGVETKVVAPDREVLVAVEKGESGRAGWLGGRAKERERETDQRVGA